MTYEGAAARLAGLADDEGRTDDFLVAVENGVVPIMTHPTTLALDVCIVIVRRTKDARTEFAMSQGRPYPLADVQRMKKAGESGIGKFVAGFYAARDPGSRATQIRQATEAALRQLDQPPIP